MGHFSEKLSHLEKAANEAPKYEDIITVCVVNFQECWGDKARNLNKIKGFIKAAAKQGVDLIAFPECALTGYDNEADKPKKEKMHYRDAETIPGPAVNEIAQLTKELGIYAAWGMPERDADDYDTLYNAIAVCGPEGFVAKHRKIHTPIDEAQWSTASHEKPFVIDTKWGPISMSLCYDSYNSPEVYRYVAAKGSRLHINITASMDVDAPLPNSGLQLESYAITNNLYIATTNMVGYGKDLNTYYPGAACILGPSGKYQQAQVYAGANFFKDQNPHVGMVTATLDLDLTRTNTIMDMYRPNPLTGEQDFHPEWYIEWYKDFLK